MTEPTNQILLALLEARMDELGQVNQLLDRLTPLAFKCECNGSDPECAQVRSEDTYAIAQNETVQRVRFHVLSHLNALGTVHATTEITT
jgi:hypothetical protein